MKSQEQKANENIIVGWFAVIAITVALVGGSLAHNHTVNHNASVQAVQQVEAK